MDRMFNCLMSTWHNQNSLEEEISIKKRLPKVWAVSKYLSQFLHWWLWETAPPIVDGTISGLVVLGSLRKQAKKGMRSKQVRNSPLHQLLPPGSCPVVVLMLASYDGELWCGSASWINPLLHTLLLVMVFHRRSSSPSWDIQWDRKT